MDSDSRAVPEKIEKEKEQTEEGPLYRVIIHNDDVTPMDFVIDILISIFQLPAANAAYIMYTAHLNGYAYVQTLPKPEAQRRINKAHFAARLKGYPLKFTIEPE
ncbi:MAG TPA: ATP-dependent Clp protease adaptor ClpS [Anaerolineales bacterium]|nr:ATP-dependent Clp protease adaptor ClpS [Anaerolineales bacterium]